MPQLSQNPDILDGAEYEGQRKEDFKQFLANLENFGFSREEIRRESRDVTLLFSSDSKLINDLRLPSLFSAFIGSISPRHYGDEKLQVLKAFLSIATATSDESRQISIDKLNQRTSKILEALQLFDELNVKAEFWLILKVDEPEVISKLQSYNREQLKALIRDFGTIGRDAREIKDQSSLTALLSWIPSLQQLEHADSNTVPSLQPYAGMINRWYRDGFDYIRSAANSFQAWGNLPVPFSRLASTQEFQLFLEKDETSYLQKHPDIKYDPLSNLFVKSIVFLGQDLAAKYQKGEKSLFEQLSQGNFPESTTSQVNFVAVMEMVKPNYLNYDRLDLINKQLAESFNKDFENIKQLQLGLEKNWDRKSMHLSEFIKIIEDPDLIKFLIDPNKSAEFKSYSNQFNIGDGGDSYVYLNNANQLLKMGKQLDANRALVESFYPETFRAPVLGTHDHTVLMFKSESDILKLPKAIEALKGYLDFEAFGRSATGYLKNFTIENKITISEIADRSQNPKIQEMAKFFGAKFARAGTFSLNQAPDAVRHVLSVKNVDKAYQYFLRTKELLGLYNYKDIPLE